MNKDNICFCPRCGDHGRRSICIDSLVPSENAEFIHTVDLEDQLALTCDVCGYPVEVDSHLDGDLYMDMLDKILNTDSFDENNVASMIDREFFTNYIVPYGREHALDVWFFDTYVKPLGMYDLDNIDAACHMYLSHIITKECYYEHGGEEHDAQLEREDAERLAKQRRAERRAVHAVTCPYCGSTNVSKITDLQKGVNLAVFGIFALPKMQGNWKCNHCKSRF